MSPAPAAPLCTSCCLPPGRMRRRQHLLRPLCPGRAQHRAGAHLLAHARCAAQGRQVHLCGPAAGRTRAPPAWPQASLLHRHSLLPLLLRQHARLQEHTSAAAAWLVCMAPCLQATLHNPGNLWPASSFASHPPRAASRWLLCPRDHHGVARSHQPPARCATIPQMLACCCLHCCCHSLVPWLLPLAAARARS